MHLLTQSALLRALGWSLLNSLWQMAFLWLVYAVFTHIFRRTSANFRHGLAVLLLGAGTVGTIISFFNAFLYSDDVQVVYRLKAWLFPGASRMGVLLETGRQWINEGIPWFSTLYLLIVGFLFVRYARQYLYSSRLTRTGLSRATPELRVFTEQTGNRMGIKKRVRVWFSSLVEGPVTLGFLKPIILIPLATVSNLSTEQVEALILHELAHIRKQDYLLNLWIAALEVVFFFNPFARLLIRSIQKEREHRCDDLVLQFRYDPHAYVSALMALAKGGHPRLVLAATGSNDRLLLQRVKRILQLNNDPEPLRSKSLIFLFFTLFIAGITLSRPGFSVSPASSRMGNAPASRESIPVTLVAVHTSIMEKTKAPAPKAPSKKKVHYSQEGYDTEYTTNDTDPVQASAPSADVDADDDDAGLIGYASSVQTDKRDYSSHAAEVNPKTKATSYTGQTMAIITSQGCILQAPAPYVPNSSFSIQHMQDSSYPGEQSVYMQQMASRQVEQAILKMQKELHWQLKILQQSSSKEIPDLKQKQQIILEQLKLQQQYLQKQQELMKKMERVGRKRVIVVI